MPTDGSGNAKVERRLAAILAADIAGYSALMGSDEARTVRDLKAHQAVILPMIGDHVGRIIDTAGDGVLAEFRSVVNAVECAIAIQTTMAERNATIETDRQMLFRIGINLGDVIHDEARVYGDGVNIAARLETLADPGGICVSGAAYDQVHKKLSVSFSDIGAQSLKNIAAHVRAYRLEIKGGAQIPFLGRGNVLPLPDRPSIAVLPFTNMSGDPSQEYFSDGITGDIITELSRFSELFVIARNSSFQYKGKSPDIRQVGRELGVRYVLEGSIRLAGDRVRITAQLIDATTGAHRWAERYDRELAEVFAVQEEVARTISTILAAYVNRAEAERTLSKTPATWEAYDLYLRAQDCYASFHRAMDVGTLYEVRRFLDQCLKFDQDYARAHALYSTTRTTAYSLGLDQEHLSDDALFDAHRLARKAVELDDRLPQAHAQLGYTLGFMRLHDLAVAEFERAFALNSNFTDWRFALTLVWAGEPARAVEISRAHIRLDPFCLPIAQGYLGLALFSLKKYESALPVLRDFVSRAPKHTPGRMWLAATYACLGRLQEAQVEVGAALKLEPDSSIGKRRKLAAYKSPEDQRHFYDALRQAGLPE